MVIQVIEKIILHMDNVYNIPNLRGWGMACKTNLPSNTAFRGFGVPQTLLVVENMVNDVAIKLGRAAEEVSGSANVKLVGMSCRTQGLKEDPCVPCVSRYERRTCTRDSLLLTTRWSLTPKICIAVGTSVW